MSNHAEIPVQVVCSLSEFYNLMNVSAQFKRDVVGRLFANQNPHESVLLSLRNILESLVNIKGSGKYTKILTTDQLEIAVDLSYEIQEMEKDIFYLERGEKSFLAYLADVYAHSWQDMLAIRQAFKKRHFTALITDRDGTTNNYCGRYRSSVQSIYNAYFLSRFCRKLVQHPIMLTSAPLSDGGLVDVTTAPLKTMILAGSKGREYIDLEGRRFDLPIPSEKKKALDRLNWELQNILKESKYEKFTLIGSGLQFKFGQTTIARQDIDSSISPKDSDHFFALIKKLVEKLDPPKKLFRIEDTGLDIEIILTIEDEVDGTKDFDKGDGVKFLAQKLALEINQGSIVVCGDTSSDLPMLRAAIELNPNTCALFVTKEENLINKVKGIAAESYFITCPDLLIGLLALLSEEGF